MTTNPRLRPPLHRVSPRARIWWALQGLTGWLIVLTPQVGGLTIMPTPPSWLNAAVGVSSVLAILHLTVMPIWRYRVHRWEVSPEAVYTQSGWINQEWRVAPISRIQTIDTTRGPLQQLLALATVTVTTASAHGPLHISGLDRLTAATLVDELTTTTQAAAGDAT